ncbi:MAG: hypothetical protein A3H97_15335, partial [Acidobacteria bacterium RIFCSPLOWO2_02_FULL_65_29]
MMKSLTAVVIVAALGVACARQGSEAPAAGPAGAAPVAGAAAQPDLGSPIAAAQQPVAGAPPAAAAPAARPGAPATPGATSAAAPAAAAVGPPPAPAAPPKAAFKEVTIPSGTTLQVTLDTAVGSDTSKVEDAVRGKLVRAVVIDGTTVVPSGSEIAGTVMEARASGKVQGLASIAFRFDRLTVRSERHAIRTARIARQAESTKKEDAKKIGIGAGAGAVIGAIAGGSKGAAIGTAIGGGAGAGVVMATKGDEVRLDP